jgi:tRNA(adenine34) deaminase
MPRPAKQVMRAAIEAAEVLQTPFGAALAMGEEVFATAACKLSDLNDTDKYAEIEAIRKLRHVLLKNDLSGFTLYTTCEPSDKSVKAAVEANISRIFFGCSHPEFFRFIPTLKDRNYSRIYEEHTIPITGGVLDVECYKLIKRFT